MFLWLSWHDLLKINLHLHRLGLSINPNCLCANPDVESVHHILFFCQYAQRYWPQILQFLSPSIRDCLLSNKPPTDWIQSNVSLADVHFIDISWSTFFCFSCWHLWKQRNIQNIQNKKPDPLSYRLILKLSLEFHSILKQNSPLVVNDRMVSIKWHPPSLGS